MEKKATLFVDGRKYGEGLYFGAETQSVLLTASYTGEPIVHLVIVCTAAQDYEPSKNGIAIPEFFNQAFMGKEEVPPAVKDCQLPAVLTHDQANVYSGLCTVLRYLVKTASLCLNPKQSKDLLGLLGHRLYCLKACSEVSTRTRLCEDHMPAIVNNDNCKLIRNRDTVPKPILLFEVLLNEPVMIHNMDKRQRVLLKRLRDSMSPSHDMNPRKKKRVVWTKDLPELEHAFAEGVDFTLTDLCILPCVHCFIANNIEFLSELSTKIPKTLRWYCRLSSIKRLRDALTDCGEDLIELPEVDPETAALTSVASDATEVLEPDTSGKNCKTVKQKDTEMTLRRDLPQLLVKMQVKGLQPKFEEYRREDIELIWSLFPKEIHPTEGELGTLRALRKCHQIENLSQAVKALARPGYRIVDFCSGGGHVGIVLAYLLPECKVILVENKEESLDRARARISTLDLKNITVYQCNLEYFRGQFQIGVALHACGVATDMVMQACIERNASFVLSPCCYGKVQNCHRISYPQSELYRNLSVSFEEGLLLGRAADKTSWNFDDKHAVEGKKCMGLVDLDRAHAAVEHGYKVSLFTMQPPTCSPKNNMLVGVAPPQ